jgi:hypothetical protein
MDGCGLADQDEEGGLETVLGIVNIAQDAPAHTEDHGPMPAHQRREGRLIPALNKQVQQIAVANPVGFLLQQGRTQMLEVSGKRAARHVNGLSP